LKDTSDDLEQCAFAGSIFPYDTEGFAGCDFEADFVERGKITMEGATVEKSKFFETGAGR
jgi:hypothetical protein